MGLRNAFDSVRVKLDETLATILPEGRSVTYGLGEDHLALAGVPPRIVWVPRTGPLERAKTSGGDRNTNPQPLWNRNLRVEAHVWADSIDLIEDLVQHMVAAMNEALGTSFRMVDEAWDTKSQVALGDEAVFVFELRMPLCREPLALVTVPHAAPDNRIALTSEITS